MGIAVRIPLLIAGFICLAFGLAAGLARLGFEFGAPAALHGPLMGGAFFGTVIGLERAVAIARPWAFLAPLAAGSAGLAWILGVPTAAGAVLLTAGGLVLLAASLQIWRRQPALHNACLAAGAGCLPLGGVAVAAGAVSAATLAWLGFLVLTIAGERLELSRFMPPSPAARAGFVAIIGTLIAGCVTAMFVPATGWQLSAAALLALGLWLAAKDIARRTIRERGLTRYIACALLLGYGWLAIGAAIALGDAQFGSGRPAYDAALHAWFLGFVFSMVFGHAPIIAPALLRVTLHYHPAFYLPLLLLHASLAARTAGGLLAVPGLRETGALGNALSIALFIATMATAALSRAWSGRPTRSGSGR